MHRIKRISIRSPRPRGRAALAAGYAERLGGLEVDQQFKFVWRLHRQVCRVLALENAINIAGGAPVLVKNVRPVADQASGGDPVSGSVDRRQSVPGGEHDDQITIKDGPWGCRHDQAAIWGTRKCGDVALDLAGLAQVNRAYLQPERGCSGLDGAELPDPGGYGGIPQRGHARDTRRDLLEQFEPFPAQAVFKHQEAGGVATRPRQARNETSADGINDKHEHNRHGSGHIEQWRGGRRARSGQDDIRRECSQFGRVLAKQIGIGRGPAEIDPHIAAIDPAQLFQPLQKRARTGLIFRIIRSAGHKQANAPDPLGLLRARGKRPYCRRHTTEKCDELAPLHSITSSA